MRRLSLVLGVLVSMLPLVNAVGTTAAGATTPTQVTVNTGTDLTVGPTSLGFGGFDGFGVQDDNAQLADQANTNSDPNAAGFLTQTGGALARIKAMNPGVVRVFVDLSWLFPTNPCPASVTSAALKVPGEAGYAAASGASTSCPNGFTTPGSLNYTPDTIAMNSLVADLQGLPTTAKILWTVQGAPSWMAPPCLLVVDQNYETPSCNNNNPYPNSKENTDPNFRWNDFATTTTAESPTSAADSSGMTNGETRASQRSASRRFMRKRSSTCSTTSDTPRR